MMFPVFNFDSRAAFLNGTLLFHTFLALQFRDATTSYIEANIIMEKSNNAKNGIVKNIQPGH